MPKCEFNSIQSMMSYVSVWCMFFFGTFGCQKIKNYCRMILSTIRLCVCVCVPDLRTFRHHHQMVVVVVVLRGKEKRNQLWQSAKMVILRHIRAFVVCNVVIKINQKKNNWVMIESNQWINDDLWYCINIAGWNLDFLFFFCSLLIMSFGFFSLLA